MTTPVAEYAGSPGSSALAHEVRHVWGEDLGGGLQTAGGVGGLLASVRASGANWAHYDGNGNVVLLTDGAGTASARYAYDAFGKLKSSSGPAAEANRYRFSTKPQERAADLSYYGYRYYAPSLGRWLSRDPLEEDGGLNLYAMVRNNPTSSCDYLGLQSIVLIPSELAAQGLTAAEIARITGIALSAAQALEDAAKLAKAVDEKIKNFEKNAEGEKDPCDRAKKALQQANKSIKSLEKNISDHEKYIADPNTYDGLDPKEVAKKGGIEKVKETWAKQIKKNKMDLESAKSAAQILEHKLKEVCPNWFERLIK